MKPLLKYPGGKERELQHVIDRLPERIDSYYEPFLGGGAIFFGLDTGKAYINDKSEDLVLFYNNVAHQHILFYYYLEEYAHNWEYLTQVIEHNYDDFKDDTDTLKQYINPLYYDYSAEAVYDKIKRMNKLQEEKGKLPEKDIRDNIECAIKQGYYYYIRAIYNNKIRNGVYDEERAAAFYFMREFCYSSMFRFNSDGEFNVPYGGISYNRKDFRAKIEHLREPEVINKFNDVIIECMDFEDFVKKYPPRKHSFMFLDPPYDSEFSSYDNMAFGQSDQERLAKYLINKCKCNWLMIIKASPLILKLYDDERVKIEGFDKKYSVSFKNRNLKDCEHLIITNY